MCISHKGHVDSSDSLCDSGLIWDISLLRANSFSQNQDVLGGVPEDQKKITVQYGPRCQVQGSVCFGYRENMGTETIKLLPPPLFLYLNVGFLNSEHILLTCLP